MGIRRFRVQLMSQLSDRIFFYTQLGENNYNNIAERKAGFFVHDAVAEYAIAPKHLSIGMGLTAWSGLARFASPSTGTILGIDAPLYQQSTNDVTDQFFRKLGIYAKGKLGKIDYRVLMAQPMAIQRSTAYQPNIAKDGNFSPLPPKMQWNTYWQYQMLHQEANTTPYAIGSYLGAQRVCNIGIGAVYQPKAIWYLAPNNKDTIQKAMLQLAADAYYDAPMGRKGAAMSAYASYTYFYFGPNYTRNLAVMNPANGTAMPQLLNGGGNGYPAYGTGHVVYAQLGYKLPRSICRKASLMPYIALQYAQYQKLQSAMAFYDAGINWYLRGQSFKLTMAYQRRPQYLISGQQIASKSSAILQCQIFIH